MTPRPPDPGTPVPIDGPPSVAYVVRPGVPVEDHKNLVYLMLIRVALATLLVLGALGIALTQDWVETLSRPFTRFTFGLLGLTYLASLIYALLLRHVRHPTRFVYLQITVDLLLISAVVHASGGGQSAFTFLYMVEVIAVALLPHRYGAVAVSATSMVAMISVSLAGYYRLLPAVPGQFIFPWEISPTELFFRIVLNVVAIAAMGILAGNLAGQTRRAGERLARHQQYAGNLASLHQNTIRSLSSGLVTTTIEGAITSINEAACEILGMDQNAAVGQPLTIRIPGLTPVLVEAGPVGTVRRHEVDAVRADGTVRRLGVSMTPLSDHTGQVVGRVIHFQDLTELRRMEQRVQRAERLASIGRLAAAIAHEIRNPLASISGSVEILRGFPGVDAETRQLIDIAVRETDRLNQLISDLLNYARPRTEDHGPLDIGEMAAEVLKSFQQERREGIRFEARVDKGVGIHGASGPVRQVLWNLLRNGAEAMPNGGVLGLRAEIVMGADARPEVLLQVSDTGVGMDKEVLDHVFEPFFSTKAKGTGLGLATVARVVEDHRGTIEIVSAKGKGTSFILRFPAIQIDERTPTDVAAVLTTRQKTGEPT